MVLIIKTLYDKNMIFGLYMLPYFKMTALSIVNVFWAELFWGFIR